MVFVCLAEARLSTRTISSVLFWFEGMRDLAIVLLITMVAVYFIYCIACTRLRSMICNFSV